MRRNRILRIAFVASWLTISVYSQTPVQRLQEWNRRNAVLQRDWHAAEADIQDKQTAFAQRELQASQAALKAAKGCLSDPSGCFDHPTDVGDAFKRLLKQIPNAVTTAGDLVDLNGTLNGLIARQLEQTQALRAIQRDLAKQYSDAGKQPNPPAGDDANDLPLLVRQQLKTANAKLPNSLRNVPDAVLAEWRDDAYLWCWETVGDRCFDGHPNEFKAFLNRHPEAVRANRAVLTQAPDGSKKTGTPSKACIDARQRLAQNEAGQAQRDCSTEVYASLCVSVKATIAKSLAEQRAFIERELCK